MAQLEEILRPPEWEFPPYPAKFITLASGERMVVRQAAREEVPLLLPAVAALTRYPHWSNDHSRYTEGMLFQFLTQGYFHV